MKIPLPCKLGDITECNGRKLQLKGVSWFKWTRGMEYTYFFNKNDKWHNTDFYYTFDENQPCSFEIPDILLKDDFIKEHGYPLKGRGYACGLGYKNGKTYIEFIITSNYLEHIKVQCDENGVFVPGGDIIFPTGWDTEEKKERTVLKSYKFIKQEPLQVRKQEPVQLSIFDFIAN